MRDSGLKVPLETLRFLGFLCPQLWEGFKKKNMTGVWKLNQQTPLLRIS